MKQVFLKVLSIIKKFFLSVRIHLHVGFCKEENEDNDLEELE